MTTYVPVPIPGKVFTKAYQSGNQTLGAATKQWLSIPRLVLALAIATAIFRWPNPVKTLAKAGPGSCQSKYCMNEVWIDTPTETLLTDQSLQVGLGRPYALPTPAEVGLKIKTDRVRAAMHSPGVRLVAHQIS